MSICTLKKVLAVLCCLTMPAAIAQVTFSPASVVFQPTADNSPDSISVTINNGNATPLVVDSVYAVNVYGTRVFSLAVQQFVIPARSNRRAFVRFMPDQNIYYRTSLIFVSNVGLVELPVEGQGLFGRPYYNPTNNLIEADLVRSLRTLISSNYTSLGYTGARNQMFEQFDNWRINGLGATQNTLQCVYTTRQIVGWSNRSAAQLAPYNFNTEHTFPQSKFNSAEPMQSDMYHLFPVDANANTSRGDDPFDVVNIPTGTPSINAPSKRGLNRIGASVYEPHDGHKGAGARALLYFVVRYQDYTNFISPYQNTLRQWHFKHLPTSVEQKRCNDISFLQNNRNPFIDYPQILRRIANLLATTNPAPVSTAQFVTDSVVITNGNYAYYTVANNGNDTLYTGVLGFAGGTLCSVNNNGNAVKVGPYSSRNIEIFNGSGAPGSDILGIPYRIGANGTTQVKSIKVRYDNRLINTSKLMSSSMAILPNPASNLLNVKGLYDGVSYPYQVINGLGQTVLQGVINGPGETLNLETLKSGIHTIQIGGKQLRFVKE